MNARDGGHLSERPRGRRATRLRRRVPLAAALLALLVLCCLFGSVAPAGAAAAPGKPTAKAPKGTITTTKPTFKWSKARGAAKYELRVYRGRKLLLKKAGITKLAWKSSKVLPKNVRLSWKVRASNARGAGPWSKSLTFKVAATPSTAKAITAFSFQGLSPPVPGAIDQTAHTIALTVPFGSDVTGLVATFTTTGAAVRVGSAVQTSGTTANDFTHPVIYTVTAADASAQTYTVTVKAGPGPAKAITAFSFQGLSPPVPGAIDQTAHTIALTVPFGSDVTGLVATFTTTGAAVRVGSAVQTSGTTANDFTHPVIYTVTAADASAQTYTVTVKASTLKIGDAYQGGIVAYIYQSGDPGYAAGETHGLIASPGDQSSMGIQWSIGGAYTSTGATGVALGTGAANTTAIIAAQGAPAYSYAAGLARAYTGGGYADWYLPSKGELFKLYLNQATIGGSWSALYYWSSSELSAVSAWVQNFSNGHQSTDVKGDLQGVHAVRAF